MKNKSRRQFVKTMAAAGVGLLAAPLVPVGPAAAADP